MPDVEAVEVNFDGITYAKGASVLKQLVAYVGPESFVAGLRAYFTTHAWGNATFDDLLSALEVASGRELRKFAAQWLETAQVNTLRPEVSIGADGTYSTVAVRQEAPADYPTLRTHRIGVGLYDLDGDRLVRRDLIEVDVAGDRTPVPALAGVKAADVLLLNDDDLTYAKMRLDERSMATVVHHIAGFESALPRALCWAAAWDMVRDAELPGRDYVALALAGLTAEKDINLVTATLRQVAGTLAYYTDPAWAPVGWAQLAATAREAVATAEPGSGFQLAWARAVAGAARSPEDLAVLRGWLDGLDVPAGLTIETELRWMLLQALVAGGVAGDAEIEAELDRDPTSSGEREAAVARALRPTAEAKEQAWAALVGPEPLPNWEHRALVTGFWHPAQLDLTRPYVARFHEAADEIWARRDSEQAQEFLVSGYPMHHVSAETLALTDAWLARDDHPAPARRLMAEGRDSVVRALRARERDAAAA
jgi:aminopeptidase N